MWGPNPSLSGETLGIVSSLPVMGCHMGVGFMGCILASPTHFSVDFSVRLRCRSHSASFWMSFRGKYSTCSCRLGVSGRRKFRILCHHLEPKPPFSVLTWAFESLAFIMSSSFSHILVSSCTLLSSPQRNNAPALLLSLRNGSLIITIFYQKLLLPQFSFSVSRSYSRLSHSANWIFLYLIEKKHENKDHVPCG